MRNSDPDLEKYSVFAEGSLSGNQAIVLSASAPKTKDAQHLCVEHQVSVCCALNMNHLSSNNYGIAWIGSSDVFQFCGHGALATAAFLDARNLLNADTIIKFAAGQYKLTKNKGRYWVSEQFAPEIMTHQYPDSRRLIGIEAIESAVCRGDDGYIILRLPDDIDLKEVQPDLEFWQATSKRALIVTSAQTKRSDIDYSLRYFAPQYGVMEDPATGSGGLIAAAFWQPRLGKINFRSYQASPEGGIIYSKFEDNRIWIGGKVTPVSIETEKTKNFQPQDSEN